LAKRVTKTTVNEYDENGKLTKTTETIWEEEVFTDTPPYMPIIPTTIPAYPLYPQPTYIVTCCGGGD
jgi:hypothetical protein